jgi:hypothetical protein
MKSLESNCKRQAVPTLKGYFYQIWQSLLLWLELEEDQQIFLEGAEDIDILSSDSAQTVQVKATSALVTLGLESTAKALNNYWDHKNKNPHIQIKYRYLTTSDRGHEQGDFFSGRKGLDVWDSCKLPDVDVSKLRQFLKRLDTLSTELKNFIENASDEELREQLIVPVNWDTGKPIFEFIEEIIEGKIINYGDRVYDLPPHESKNAIPKLLKYVWEIVCKDKDRWLRKQDFLEVFQNSTAELIPRHELRELKRNSKHYNSAASFPDLNSASNESPFGFDTGMFLESFTIPDMSHFAERDKITTALKERLNNTGILVLNGSTGMGKSILSHQTVGVSEGNWRKLDLRGNEPKQIKRKLVQAINLIAQTPERVDLVIDDLNFDSGVNTYENDLAKLIYLQKIRNGRILFTSHQRLPVRVENLFNLSDESFYSVPLLNESEIKDLLVKNGCPSGHKLKYWSKIIPLLGGGHPLLSHAHVKRNAENKWQSLPEDALFFNPQIDSVKQELKKIGEQFSEDARLLLYRLTIFSGRFKRKQALDIGKINPSINLQGEQFDKLVGPWIESVEDEYYRLSNLLSGTDRENFTEEEIKELHKTAAKSFLNKTVGIVEFSGLLWHGLLGEVEDALVAAARLGLNEIDEVNAKWVYQYIDWFILCNTENGKKLYPENDFINFMLRQLQFEAASKLKPEKAVQIADIIEREFNEWDEESNIISTKKSAVLLFLTKIVFHINVPFPIKQAFARTVQLIALLEDKNFFPSHPQYQQEFERVSEKLLDPAPFIYPLPARCRTADDVIEFLTVLAESDLPESHPIWKLFRNSYYVAGILVDAIWLRESKLEAPDWNSCLEKLDWVIQYAIDNNVDSIGVDAYIGKAIIYQEYLKETEQAFSILDEAEHIFANSKTYVQDYRAKVFYFQKQYEKALDIWKEVLPRISEDINSTRANSFRDAEFCAVNLNRWNEASEFALMGERAYRLQGMGDLSNDNLHDKTPNVTSLGYRADYAFAEWKKGNKKTSITEFFNILEGFKYLPDPKDDIRVNLLYKRIGHTIGWLSYITSPSKNNSELGETLFEPTPTCFTNQQISDEIRNTINDLPLLPFTNLKYLLAILEHRLKIGNNIFKDFEKEINNSKSAHAHIGYLDLDIKHSIRELNVGNLIAQIVDYCAELEQYAAFTGNKIENLNREGVIRGFLSATLIIAVMEQKIDLLPLNKWKQDINTYLPGSTYLLQILDCIEELINSDTVYCIKCLIDAEEIIEKRAIAAVILSNIQVLDAETRFYANSLLLTSGILKNIEEEVRDYIEEMIVEGWVTTVKLQRFSLISPQIYADRILSACNDKTIMGITKAGKVLFEARNSVRVKLSKEIIKNLHNLSMGIN